MTPLDPGAVTVDHVRFIGATLWTDFLLEGVAGEGVGPPRSRRGTVRFHRRRPGTTQDGTGSSPRASPRGGMRRTGRSSRRSSRRRRGSGSRPSSSPTTHRARNASGRAFEGSRLNPGFVSDLDSVIARFQPPDLDARAHARPRRRAARGDACRMQPRWVQPGRGARARRGVRGRGVREGRRRRQGREGPEAAPDDAREPKEGRCLRAIAVPPTIFDVQFAFGLAVGHVFSCEPTGSVA